MLSVFFVVLYREYNTKLRGKFRAFEHLENHKVIHILRQAILALFDSYLCPNSAMVIERKPI